MLRFHSGNIHLNLHLHFFKSTPLSIRILYQFFIPFGKALSTRLSNTNTIAPSFRMTSCSSSGRLVVVVSTLTGSYVKGDQILRATLDRNSTRLLVVL
ncbi:Protein of unknown function [Pyronema omphalodes CBS 100304]|uniref:Uncharacterized protein n=1 Tax=Pyronema omphalodes (strain CBS 100304) TaxID=1076935 RepID=U4LFN3_PYROM|nr:Protein of unknown function [Pyronema omphalodes CBS 100304]